MYSHVLVPVLIGADHNTQAAIAVAQHLADDGAKITLLHAIEPISPYTLTYLPGNFASERIGRIDSELTLIASKIPRAGSVVIEGHSSRAILDWAQENEPDCIVLASHQPGMQDLLLGSTASKVVRHAKCAVHVIR